MNNVIHIKGYVSDTVARHQIKLSDERVNPIDNTAQVITLVLFTFLCSLTLA